MTATNTMFSNNLGALERMTACGGVGIIHSVDDGLGRLIWVEEEVTIAGGIGMLQRRLVIFSDEWQITVAQAASLASPTSPRLDG